MLSELNGIGHGGFRSEKKEKIPFYGKIELPEKRKKGEEGIKEYI